MNPSDPKSSRGSGNPPGAALDALARDVIACERCPRLRAYCLEVARVRRAAYRNQVYWGKPVPGFGDPKAWLVIVGLAPGAHGSNRTGRMFTGDRSGEWLYGELHRQGLCSRPDSLSADDGLRLDGVFITAAGRCAPPDNKPTPLELDRCREYLVREFRALGGARVYLALGRVGFDAIWRARREAGLPLPDSKPAFAHGVRAPLPDGATLLASYHPSQQNTSTGKLTRDMWRRIFVTALRLKIWV